MGVRRTSHAPLSQGGSAIETQSKSREGRFQGQIPTEFGLGTSARTVPSGPCCPPNLGGRDGFLRAFLYATALFLLFASPAFAEYRTFNLESLRIIVDSDWASQGAPGYLPVRLDITNSGEAREIVLTASQQHWFDPSRGRMRGMIMLGSFDMGSIDTQQTIRLKRGDHVKLTVPIPVFADNESIQIRLRERGRAIEGFSFLASMQSARSLDEAPVLLVTQPSSPLGSMIKPRPVPVMRGYGGFSRGGLTAGGVGYTPAGPSGPPLDFFLDPERLPTNWLSYTTLRGVLIAPSEWKQLAPAQQDALLTWTAAGGDLLLVDGTPESILPASERPVGQESHGDSFPYLFGQIHSIKSDDLRNLEFTVVMDNTTRAGTISSDDYSLPANRKGNWGVIAERGFLLPIPGVGYMPTSAYLLILVLFIFVIGPMNYFYLWRKRRQVLLVLTVPLLSAVFIALLTGYALLHQGLDVRARAMSLTVLDQNARRAATRSMVSLYPGGFMPSGGVQFAADTAVFPFGTDDMGQRGRMGLNLTDNQRFQSGLLKSRTPTNFEEIRVQPARQRLSFERAGKELRVVNGLGSTIHHLFYRDGSQWWSLENLPAGQKGTLTMTGTKPPPFPGSDFNRSAHAGRFQEIESLQPDQSYLAVLETSPFWDPGVAQPKELESFHLVLGYPETQP